jgi:hypothetical protein
MDGGTTSILTSNRAIGVNHSSYSNTAYQTAFGIGFESGSFNWNEAWVVEFDQAVRFSEIDFSSIGTNEQFEVTIEGVAGTFTFAGTPSVVSFRIAEFTVETIPIPEPGSGLLALRRKR